MVIGTVVMSKTHRSQSLYTWFTLQIKEYGVLIHLIQYRFLYNWIKIGNTNECKHKYSNVWTFMFILQHIYIFQFTHFKEGNFHNLVELFFVL